MRKKSLLIAGLLTSVVSASVLVGLGANNNAIQLYGSEPKTNIEYEIATWQYDGWYQNASIVSEGEIGTVFMFSSTSTGANPGVKVREGIKLAVVVIQDDIREDVTETLRYSVVGNSPSILHNENSVFVNDSNHNPIWPAHYLCIDKVRIFIGDLTLNVHEESAEFIKNDSPDNFTVKSLIVDTILTYSDYGDEQPGYWLTYDHIAPRPFTSDCTPIGKYDGKYPYTGIKIGTIIVKYGCSY